MRREGRSRLRALGMSAVLVMTGIGAVTTATVGSGASTDATPPTTCQPPPVVPAGGTAVRATTGATPSSAVATVKSPSGATQSVGEKCSWRITFDGSTVNPDGKSVAFTQATDVYMALGTSYTFNVHFDGVECTGTGDVLNGFGGGGAQAKMDRTYCNTDSGFTTALGFVEIVGTTYVSGPQRDLSYFGTPERTSFVSGHDVFFGIFQLCSEDPVGQTTSYACVYWFGSPLY